MRLESRHQRSKHDELVVREEEGFLLMEFRMSEDLERKMAKAVSKTAGIIKI